MDNATLALILACISLGVHALDKILHLIAPRTKTTLDDRAVALLDKLEALLLKFGGPTIVVLAIVVASLAACTWLRSTGKEVAQGVVDCTKGSAADAVKQFAPLVENQLAGTVDSEGQLDKAKAKELLHGFEHELGGCVAAKAFAALLAPPKPDPAAPKSSPLYVDGRSARAVFEDLRREQFGGATFKLEDGTL
jgi:hypothetical protein